MGREMTKESIEFKIYADVWALHKKYIGISVIDDKKWDEYINESSMLCMKYDNHLLARDLCLAVTNQLERDAVAETENTKIA